MNFSLCPGCRSGVVADRLILMKTKGRKSERIPEEGSVARQVHAGGNERLTSERAFRRRYQFFRGGKLQNISTDAGVERFLGKVGVWVGSKEHNRLARIHFESLAARLEAVHSRHLEIRDDQIR